MRPSDKGNDFLAHIPPRPATPQGDGGLVGKWAVCSRGRIGRIEGRKELPWGLSWIGTGLDGTPWASRNPAIIAESESQLIARAASAEAGMARLEALAAAWRTVAKNFADHDADCTSSSDGKTCDCGYRAALGACDSARAAIDAATGDA